MIHTTNLDTFFHPTWILRITLLDAKFEKITNSYKLTSPQTNMAEPHTYVNGAKLFIFFIPNWNTSGIWLANQRLNLRKWQPPSGDVFLWPIQEAFLNQTCFRITSNFASVYKPWCLLQILNQPTIWRNFFIIKQDDWKQMIQCLSYFTFLMSQIHEYVYN